MKRWQRWLGKVFEPGRTVPSRSYRPALEILEDRSLPSAPPAPAILGPANAASVTVPFTASWSAVTSNPSGVVAYNWQVSTSSTFTQLVWQDSVGSTSLQDTVSGLANGTYFWRVQAVNGAFEQGAWSTPRSFTVTGVGPGSPGTPVLTPTEGYNTFHPFETGHTSWSAVPGAVTYVFESSRGNSSFAVGPSTFRHDNIDQTTHSFTLADPGNYFSRVYAVSADGIRGVPSNVISYSYAFNNPVGPPPRLLSPIGGEALTLPITLTWEHVPNPQVFGYDLEISNNSSFSSIELLGVQQHFPSVPIRDLTSGTKFWRVFSIHGNDEPSTVQSPGSPAVTAPSATGTFTISSAPARPVSVALEGVDQPQAVTGGTFPFVSVQLTAGAPASGATISMTSSNPAVASVPATITMPGTHAWTNFQIALGQVTTPTPVTITATLNGVSASGQFTVLPAALKEFHVSPIAVSGGTEAIAWVDLSGPAPAGGAVLSLSSSSPVASVPSTVTVPEGAWSQSIPVTTTTVTEATGATITASYKGVSKPAQMTVTAPRPPATLSIDPISRIGSDPGSATGKVTIASYSAYDQTFQLTSSNPAAASVDNFVTVPAGSLHGGFFVFTNDVATTTNVTITASGAGVTKSVVFPVYPTGTAPSLSTVTVNPTSVRGGTALEGLVNLNSMAPAGGVVVTLSDNSPAVTVPASVTVPAGAITATFPVTTSSVTADTTVTISGTRGTTQSTTLTVTSGPTGPFLSGMATDAFSIVGGNSTTATVFLSAAAPPGGAVVTLTADSSAVTVPATVTVPADAVAATFPINTRSVTAPTTVNINGSYGGMMQFARVSVRPPATGPVMASLTVNPTSVVGSASATGTVTLSGPAPAGGAEVFVTHVSLALAEDLLGIIVTVPAGATSATFPVDTYRVSAAMVGSIRGTFGGITQTAVLTVNPATAPAATLSALSVNPTSVVGGNSSTGTVTLSGAAPSGGVVVTLSDNSSAVTVPGSVTVAAGATSASFTVTTSSVTASTTATITAASGGVTRTASLTVTPAASAPAAPSLISPAVNATPAQPVAFDWNNVANATQYEIQIDNTSTISAPFVANQIVTVSQATIGGLPSQRLWWRVRAQNAAGVWGPFSSTRRFTPQAAPAAASLSAVSVNPTSVVGPASATGTVTLTAPAPTGGMVITLTSSNTAAATVPASVTVAAGATSANFTITTQSVTASTGVTITASNNGTTRSAVLTVNPTPAAATLSTLTLNPSTVTGGNSSTATVTLNGPAPSGGMVITLASSNTAAATVPASVTVPAGATSVTFTITTQTVTASTSAVISATSGGVTRSATLTVTTAATDTVAITKAEYKAQDRVLLVEATSSSNSATLQVFDAATNQLIGTLTNVGGGKYIGQFSWPTNPQNIIVRSSQGGSATRAVTLK